MCMPCFAFFLFVVSACVKPCQSFVEDVDGRIQSLNTSLSTANEEDDAFLDEAERNGKPVKDTLNHLITPRTDVSGFDPNLVEQAQALIKFYINLNLTVEPWNLNSENGDAIENMKDGVMFGPGQAYIGPCSLWDYISIRARPISPSDIQGPLVAAFALGYIRGIPEWQDVYQEYAIQLGVQNLYIT